MDSIESNMKRKEQRLNDKSIAKSNFLSEQFAHKKQADNKKLAILDKNCRLNILTKSIELARQDVILFKDDEELKDEAVNRLRNLYKELEEMQKN